MNLIQDDLRHTLSRIPRDVRNLMRARKLILAGGFIRATIAGEKPSDIDLFGESKDQLEAAARALADTRKEARIHSTDNAYTVFSPGRMPVQFIHRWTYKDPERVLYSFDFTVCQAVIWWLEWTLKDEDGSEEKKGRWVSLCGDSFYPDLASRRLRYCAPTRNEDAGGSLLRVRKYINRGYHIEAPSLAQVVARLVGGVKEISENTDEAWLGQTLTGLLREVDPLMVVDGLEVVNEHEVEQE